MENKIKRQKKKTRKKVVEKFLKGMVHLQSTFNNIIVTITTIEGNVLGWSSSGVCGFKGRRKKTPIAAKQVSEDAIQTCIRHGMKEIIIQTKGIGPGRETALRTLCNANAGFKIKKICDITSIPHNGCRAPKKRRL